MINTRSFTVILGKKKDLNDYIVYHLEKLTLQMDFSTFSQEIRLFEAFEFKRAVIHIRRWRGEGKSRNHDIWISHDGKFNSRSYYKVQMNPSPVCLRQSILGENEDSPDEVQLIAFENCKESRA